MFTSPQGIGAIGLLFDIVGVILLFYFGPPTLPITKDGHLIIPFNQNDEEKQKSNKRLYQKHQMASFIALGLLMIGFVLQFIGSVLQIPKT